jgi:methionyl-tRNA formyltransferase
VLAVYTQPPRPAGRGKRLRKSPVHEFAEVMGLPVRTPESFRKSKVIDGLEALNADVACVVAYGQILPKRALAAPPYGCLNLHGSLLPRWRGAAPIQRAIMAGDEKTAAQIMQMEPGLDTGPVLLSEVMEITVGDTAGSLSQRMSQAGARLWAPALAAVERGSLTPTPQEGEPTYAEKITKAEAEIDWTLSAVEIDRHIRGLNPFPGAFTFAEGKRLKLWDVEIVESEGEPGDLHEDVVSCGQGALRLITVQPEGKPRMSASDWLNGVDVERLG